MTLPAVLFGMLVATLLGALYHLWRGGNLVRLLSYILFSWIGFWIGHYIGSQLGIRFLVFGPLFIGSGILGSILIQSLGYWLTFLRESHES